MTAMGDIQRISDWLAEDTADDKAQGAANDLNAALDSLSELVAAARKYDRPFPSDSDRERLLRAVSEVLGDVYEPA